jgi:DNA-binding NarL/FixJ family response regulator
LRRVVAGAALPLQREVIDALRSANPQREPEAAQSTLAGMITPHEGKVLRALAEGLDSEGIAERLGTTVEEERAHTAALLVKVGARSRLQALVVAARLGVVEIE